MATLITKQHDTKIRFTDKPKIDGQRVLIADLAGCTLSFLLKAEAVAAIKATAVIEADVAPDQQYAVFYYDPVATDVDEIAEYQQEWEVVYPSGKILTFPNTVYNTVKIIADLG